VHLGTEDGLPKKCVISLDTIITIRKELLAEKITNLAPEKIDKLEEAIKFALDLKGGNGVKSLFLTVNQTICQE
jgi:mRNA-degrading endonuclease toxin of MazEF toxin-antitoxin module